MKVRFNMSIDSEIVKRIKERGVNASRICEEALRKAVEDPAMIEERAKVVDKAREKMLRQFLSLRLDVVDNEPAMKYYSEQLGISAEELIALRKERG